MAKRFATGILLFGLASCEPVLEPHDIAGEFVLQSTPVTLHRDNGSHQVLADTIRIASNGTAIRVVFESIDTQSGSYIGTRVEEYRYAIRRGSVEFSLVCPPNALMLCTPPPHMQGTPTNTGMSLRLAYAPGSRLHYERVRNVRAD